MTRFLINDPRTLKFVTEKNGIGDSKIACTIGVERDGEIIAGILYDNLVQGASVCLHVAAKEGVGWVTRALLRLVFGYAFNGLGVKRITGFVAETNAKARRFDEHVGFRREALLSDVYPDGGLIVYKMTRGDCRYV